MTTAMDKTQTREDDESPQPQAWREKAERGAAQIVLERFGTMVVSFPPLQASESSQHVAHPQSSCSSRLLSERQS